MSGLNVAFASQISAAAARHGLNPRLLAAVAAQETGGPGARSGRNIVGDGGHGHGLFQIDDRYHAFARSEAALDPAANADYAAGLLAGLIRRCGGNVHRALSAYNAGSPDARGTLTDWGDGRPVAYADSVERHMRALGADSLAGATDRSAAPVAGDGATVAGFVTQTARSLAAGLAGLFAANLSGIQPWPAATPAGHRTPPPHGFSTPDPASAAIGDE